MIRLPSVLKVMVGKESVRVRARRLSEALEAAYEALPGLRHHLEAENGGLRPHVLVLLNDENVPRDAIDATRLDDGDEIWIWQAITGG